MTKILITLSEISDRWNWEKFCDEKWYNYWCMKEFWIWQEEVELTIEEAKDFNLI